MIEFIRGIFASSFKGLVYFIGSGLIAAFILSLLGTSSTTAFLCVWALVGIVLFTFPNFMHTEL